MVTRHTLTPSKLCSESESAEQTMAWRDSCFRGGWHPSWVTSEGDFNVSHAVCYFAGNVATGNVRVPRCRWADSPAVNHSGHFFGGALLQGSSRSLKMRLRLAD